MNNEQIAAVQQKIALRNSVTMLVPLAGALEANSATPEFARTIVGDYLRLQGTAEPNVALILADLFPA
jgi:hypothetical protein